MRQRHTCSLELIMRKVLSWQGAVRVKRKDGQTFVIRPEPQAGSPLDVAGIDLGITTPEIVQFIHEGRRVYGMTEDGA